MDANGVVGVGKEMDVQLEEIAEDMKGPWANFGQKAETPTAKKVMELMNSAKYQQTVGRGINA